MFTNLPLADRISLSYKGREVVGSNPTLGAKRCVCLENIDGEADAARLVAKSGGLGVRKSDAILVKCDRIASAIRALFFY